MSVLWDVIVAMGVVGYPSDLKSVFCACNAKLFPQTSVSSDWHTVRRQTGRTCRLTADRSEVTIFLAGKQ